MLTPETRFIAVLTATMVHDVSLVSDLRSDAFPALNQEYGWAELYDECVRFAEALVTVILQRYETLEHFGDAWDAAGGGVVQYELSLLTLKEVKARGGDVTAYAEVANVVLTSAFARLTETTPTSSFAQQIWHKLLTSSDLNTP